MTFKKILFHTRFREQAFNSLKAILALKAVGLETIVLTHVIPRDEVSFVPYGGYMKEAEEQIRAEARIRFKDWQQSLADLGVKSKIRIEVGLPNAEILSVAAEEDVDLIVIGRKKRTLFEKVYVGSHILDILRRSDIPVLMNKHMVQYEWEGEELSRVNDRLFLRPMLATDWSQPSANALQCLSTMKGVTEKILVVHNIGSKISKGLDKASLAALEKESKDRLEAYCSKLEQWEMATEYHLSMGKTVPEIMRLSRDHNATMIVMGKTGKDWFREYWLGGVSHRLAELSELPVLLVP